MRKLLIVVLVTLSLTSCGKNELTKNVNGGLDYLQNEEGKNIYPDGMCDGGKSVFGDGYDSEATDIFSVIERKIWNNE